MTDAPVERLARSIAAFRLPASRRPEPIALDDATWRALFRRLRAERLSGLAVASVAAAWLEPTEAQLDELLAFHRDAMAWHLGIERKLIALAEVFDADGVAFAVLKGPSVAHAAYADPALRSFADLDLLVPTRDYPRACALLDALGHIRRRPEPRPGFEVRFGKASVHRHPADGIEVDLHRTLVVGPFGLWLRAEELLERSTRFALGGRDIPRLDDTGMLLNAAMHASLGWSPPRLVPLRDVAEVAGRDVDWGVLGGWAQGWRMTAVLEHAFTATASTLGAEMPPDAWRCLRLPASRREARALAAYVGRRRAEGGIATGTIRAIPGLRAKASYIAALALPSREFVVARTGTRSYMRRLSKPVAWARARLASRHTAAPPPPLEGIER